MDVIENLDLQNNGVSFVFVRQDFWKHVIHSKY
jgi:hypothetical protein